MANFIGGIVSISLGAVMLANVFISQVKNVNQSYDCVNAAGNASVCSWSASEVALWGILTLAGIIGMVYGVLAVFGLV